MSTIKPNRIISLVPSQTELLYDLGLESLIVGITKFCVYPYHLKQTKTIVGGTKNIKIEKIKKLKPDIILCNKEENTKEIVRLCKQIAITHVSNIYTIDDTLALITLYGNLFSCTKKALKINRKIKFHLENFNEFIKNKPCIKVAYFIWRNPWMVAANKTFINHILTLNKYTNIYKDRERYPEIELKNIEKQGNPDIIFLSSEPYPFKKKHALEISNFTGTAKIVFINGEFFSWYGSRLLMAFAYFKEIRSTLP